MDDIQDKREDILALSSDIVASYVSNNDLERAELPALITSVYKTLAGLSAGAGQALTNREPAVPVKKSVRPDYIICLEDGIKLKMLKRHLKSRYNMSPEDYREKWGLPSDYPMVAPNYANQRRELAKQIGLGRGRPKKSD